MGTVGNNEMSKRIKISDEEEEKNILTDEDMTKTIGDGTEDNIEVSEQVELEVSHIHEKISQFSQLVSELMESGKSMLSELISEFEGRMISIYKEQLEKWEEEIKELRLLDASNEEIKAVLQNAKRLFQNVPDDS